MKLINYGHACFKVIGKDITLLFDPYQDKYVPGLKLPEVDCNVLLISHLHDDHNADYLVRVHDAKEIEIEVVEVAHDKENGQLRGLNKIHIVNVDGIRIAHFGDIGTIDIDTSKLMGIDIALIPINGFYTIGAKEMLELIKKISPKCVIPMHYYVKEKNIGYPDGGQIDILTDLAKDIHYIECDEFEYCNEQGIYVFKGVRN